MLGSIGCAFWEVCPSPAEAIQSQLDVPLQEKLGTLFIFIARDIDGFSAQNGFGIERCFWNGLLLAVQKKRKNPQLWSYLFILQCDKGG